MRNFEYVAPKSLREAVSILAKATDGEVKPLAGGTDLIAQMKEKRRQPSVVLDLKKIPELTKLTFSTRDGLHIGAATPCTDVAEFAKVKEKYPMIAQAASLVGSVQIQNRASIGGNICNAAPSADTIPGLICLGAKAVVIGPGGKRQIPLEEFFAGPGKTVLASNEILVEVVVPNPPANSSGCYLRFIPRAEMDIAVAGVGSFVVMDSTKKVCKEVRIALAAVAPTPVRAKAAEDVLRGQAPSQKLLVEAGEKAVLAANPITDVRGSAAYRKELVKVLTRRTLAAVFENLGVGL